MALWARVWMRRGTGAGATGTHGQQRTENALGCQGMRQLDPQENAPRFSVSPTSRCSERCGQNAWIFSDPPSPPSFFIIFKERRLRAGLGAGAGGEVRGSSEARGGSREALALCDVQGTGTRMRAFPAAALTRTSANPCLARASGVERRPVNQEVTVQFLDPESGACPMSAATRAMQLRARPASVPATCGVWERGAEAEVRGCGTALRVGAGAGAGPHPKETPGIKPEASSPKTRVRAPRRGCGIGGLEQLHVTPVWGAARRRWQYRPAGGVSGSACSARGSHSRA
ncbi:uncharacterized protein LOC132219334 [Myotis daubentonii]|uniref:uncharacterized protein LOC132219334 n=1 Tax=Myotis daubentonii TaxID=98922 RepID=UPI002872E3A4|nr:uncharacterized protein LOC132219334 [Myotis daubentonii]